MHSIAFLVVACGALYLLPNKPLQIGPAARDCEQFVSIPRQFLVLSMHFANLPKHSYDRTFKLVKTFLAQKITGLLPTLFIVWGRLVLIT